MTTHGLSRTKTYRIWQSMRDRVKHDPHYVKQGITVCERWTKFENFVEDMGFRPTGLTLDRRNTRGNYEPKNCRWATCAQQGRNRINVKLNHVKVRRIRQSYERGDSISKLAAQFKVTRSAIGHIISGRIWPISGLKIKSRDPKPGPRGWLWRDKWRPIEVRK